MIIGGREIKFCPEKHRYTIDGVVFETSVTGIISKVLFENQYDTVPEYVLENARINGNQIHNAIEHGTSLFLNEQQKQKYNEYVKMIKSNNIEVLEKEQIVYYVCEETGEVLYIGTLDLMLMWRDTLTIGDIKTTYALDLEYLSWQLSFYKLAYEQLYGKEIKRALAFWLPTRKMDEMRSIKFKTKEEVLKVVKDYGNIIQSQW